MSRADYKTASQKETEFFSDFLTNFDRNPITGLLAKVTNEDAIKLSIKNIVRTALTERFYQPLTGSKVATAMFELQGPEQDELIKQTISTALKNEERRANILNIDVAFEAYTLVVNIDFECINFPGKQFSVAVFLKRIR